MNEMLDDLVEVLKYANSKDDLFDQVAIAYKKGFDALVKVGFTREEALEITARRGSAFKHNGG